MNPVRATITPVTLGRPRPHNPPVITPSGLPHTLLFNPASLKISLTNRLQNEDSSGGKGEKIQNVHATTTKLETEILYDTTDIGQDVRNTTSALKSMAVASAAANAAAPPAPPFVQFRWGRFTYVGVIESLTETLDFWSNEGVPLRATIQLVIQNVNGQLLDTIAPGVQSGVALNPIPTGGTGATGVAANAGDPGAGRAIAAMNGMESMRFGAGAALAVSTGVQLQAAAGFSVGFSAGIGISAGIGFGIGASAGAGVSAGFGAGASAGFSAGASAGFGASASAGFGAGASAGTSVGFGASGGASFGASASAAFSAGASARASGASAGFAAGGVAGFAPGGSAGYASGGVVLTGGSVSTYAGVATAGVSASYGAFSGLGPSRATMISYRIDPRRVLVPPVLVSGPATRFDITGRAISVSSPGLSADVSGGVRFV
jgi:Contractile injection system tube protein